MKDWYKLRNVEYSTNFNFFLQNQIFMSKSGNKTSFNSSLESCNFKSVQSFKSDFSLDKCDIDNIIKNIHANLLNGNYGKGEFIN